MLLTEVTLAVEQEIVGRAAGIVKFRIAGGANGGSTVRVGGMPTFELGGRYIVFLRPGYETTAAPIVGVNQGYYRVVRQEVSGQDMVLDAASNIVLGVESDRVVVRRNPERDAGREPNVAELPVPGAGVPMPVTRSAEFERYWRSEEPPLAVGDFIEIIRDAKETIP